MFDMNRRRWCRFSFIRSHEVAAVASCALFLGAGMVVGDDKAIVATTPANSPQVSAFAVENAVFIKPNVTLTVEQQLARWAKASSGLPAWTDADRERARWAFDEPLSGHVVELLAKLSTDITVKDLSQVCEWAGTPNGSLRGVPRDEEARLFVRSVMIEQADGADGETRITVEARAKSGLMTIALVPRRFSNQATGDEVGVAGRARTVSGRKESSVMQVHYVIEKDSRAVPSAPARIQWASQGATAVQR